ncbi:hypothetical protein ACFRBN_25230 [Streptomyces sp. NPDC056627]|uniref:hypothetical protein n=1 Tax=Streptomyces sp. NPDC056627 TaxID=3345881 RepID=UPI0009696FE6|nr:hypothetical protein AMK10_22390 [Streptomyces sp. CB02058]
MLGSHARPVTYPLHSRSLPAPGAARTPAHHGREGRHRLPGHPKGAWHRRVLAYRQIELVQSSGRSADDRCLLLVLVRKVVGHVEFRLCDSCSEGLITEVSIEKRFHRSGLGTRALSHLRARYPGVVWRTTLDRRVTRDLMRRMRVLRQAEGTRCSHGGDRSVE